MKQNSRERKSRRKYIKSDMKSDQKQEEEKSIFTTIQFCSIDESIKSQGSLSYNLTIVLSKHRQKPSSRLKSERRD